MEFSLARIQEAAACYRCTIASPKANLELRVLVNCTLAHLNKMCKLFIAAVNGDGWNSNHIVKEK